MLVSLRLRQIIDLLATDKSRYFSQPRPIIVNYYPYDHHHHHYYYYYYYYYYYPCLSVFTSHTARPLPISLGSMVEGGVVHYIGRMHRTGVWIPSSRNFTILSLLLKKCSKLKRSSISKCFMNSGVQVNAFFHLYSLYTFFYTFVFPLGRNSASESNVLSRAQNRLLWACVVSITILRSNDKIRLGKIVICKHKSHHIFWRES